MINLKRYYVDLCLVNKEVNLKDYKWIIRDGEIKDYKNSSLKGYDFEDAKTARFICNHLNNKKDV